MNTQRHAAAIRELLAEVTSRAAEVEAKLADLHAEQRGLELALARITARDDGSAAEPATPSRPAPEFVRREEEWEMLGKTESVKRVLERATKPLGPAEIVNILNSVGLPQKDSESVRGALAYLKRKEKAIYVDRSQWVLVDGAVHQRLQREGKANTTYAGTAPVPAGAVPASIHPTVEGGDAGGIGFDRVHGGDSSGKADHRVLDHSRAPIGAPN